MERSTRLTGMLRANGVHVDVDAWGVRWLSTVTTTVFEVVVPGIGSVAEFHRWCPAKFRPEFASKDVPMTRGFSLGMTAGQEEAMRGLVVAVYCGEKFSDLRVDLDGVVEDGFDVVRNVIGDMFADAVLDVSRFGHVSVYVDTLSQVSRRHAVGKLSNYRPAGWFTPGQFPPQYVQVRWITTVGPDDVTAVGRDRLMPFALYTQDDGSMVVKAPFDASCHDEQAWRDWASVFGDRAGPIDVEAAADDGLFTARPTGVRFDAGLTPELDDEE